MIELVDTHCHIHEATGNDDVAERWHRAGKTDPATLLADAQAAGVAQLLCVGCTLADSKLAVDFAARHQGVWATIGIHPHEAKDYANNKALLDDFARLLDRPAAIDGGVLSAQTSPTVLTHGSARWGSPQGRHPSVHRQIVAIGECGLDYFYSHSPKDEQMRVLRFQIELALKHDVPMVFHIREAFDDFWQIFDAYAGIRGVIHSFSAGARELGQIVERGLYVGLNGIMTFTKNEGQLAAAKAVPRDRLLLETDAPFLTPVPFRGKVCEPKHVRVTAKFLADLRGESLTELAAATTANARKLFDI